MTNINKYILLSTILMISVPAVSAAPTIDGNPGDWGPAGFLNGIWSLNDTWLPNDNVQFRVEDNRNPKYPLSSGSIAPYTGVHIQGAGHSFVFYDEPLITLKDGGIEAEPYGYEIYDLEAIYFQQDDDYVYLLVVTSLLPDGGGDLAPGDLRIDLDKTTNSGDGYKYELGVKLGSNTGLTQFHIYAVSDWAETPDYVPASLPARIVSGTDIGSAAGAYVQCSGCNNNPGGTDYSEPNYIIELKIPKSVLGISSGPSTANPSDFSIEDNCTNDEVSIPEFATIALPIAAILGLVFVLRIKRKEH